MTFGILGRTCPGMRHVLAFWIGPREGVVLRANLGRAIVTIGDLLSQRRIPLPKLPWADMLFISIVSLVCSSNSVGYIQTGDQMVFC